MNKTIFMISGFTDVEKAGNQTFKNTIKYLSEYGYRLKVFTFIPNNYGNLQDPSKIFDSNVEFHRLPKIIQGIINFGKLTKDSLGRWKLKKRDSNALESSQAVDYYSEYNTLGRMIYIFYLFLFFLPIETLRTSYFYSKSKADLFYGVNCQGAIVASLMGRIFRKPVIIRYHGTGVVKADLKSLRRKILVFDEIAGMKVRSDAIIMANDGTNGDEILELLNVDRQKVHFWMNGLDIDNLILTKDFDPEAFKKEKNIKDKKLIIMISRLVAWKRVDRGIQGMNLLVNEYKRDDFILLIIGDGPEREKLEELAKSLGLSENVRFAGGIPHKEVAKYLAISDLFLSFYDISNLGNPVLEALYFGVPVITISDRSTRDLLIDGYNSTLIELENMPDNIPAAITKIIDNRDLRKSMSENTRKTFEQRVLSWQKRIDLEDQLIKRLIR